MFNTASEKRFYFDFSLPPQVAFQPGGGAVVTFANVGSGLVLGRKAGQQGLGNKREAAGLLRAQPIAQDGSTAPVRAGLLCPSCHHRRRCPARMQSAGSLSA